MDQLEDLRQEVKKLSALLEDAHPGLSPWHLAVELSIDKIASIYRGDKYEDN